MEGAHAGRVRTSREMRLRVISATVLIPFGLAVVWLGDWVLAVACAAFGAVMGWEWARMARLRLWWTLSFAGAVPVMVAAGLNTLEGFIALAVVSVLAASACGGSGPKRLAAGFGAFYVALPPLAMWLVRDGADGLLLTMAVMVFVWSTDISAFFGGRGLGGPLLSPRESPNKRWSGALSAFGVTMLIAAAGALFLGLPVVPWIVAGLSLSVAAQLGDLLESRFKRAFGVKDAGRIIPGHGGLLDRVDGLGAAFVYTLGVLALAPTARLLLGLTS